MQYRDFTPDSVRHRFDVTVETASGTFAAVPPVPIGADLVSRLGDGLPLATAQNSEKARSELIIAPILLHLWRATSRRVSIFSGVEFNVERKNGLSGYCDYLLSRSANALSIEAPAVALAEAKKEDLNAGVPQCVAEMVGAQRFKHLRGHPTDTIYGCITSGTVWRFLKLQDVVATVVLSEVFIDDVDRIFGILMFMVGINDSTAPLTKP